MKKFILVSIALFFTVAIKADEKDNKATAKTESVAENVLRQFSYNFYKATDVKWNINSNYQQATFKLDDKVSYAIYDLQNEFLVATQAVAATELPADAFAEIKKSYPAYKALNIVKILSRPADFKFSDDTGSYWASLVQDNKQVILLISPDSDITVVNSIKLN